MKNEPEQENETKEEEEIEEVTFEDPIMQQGYFRNSEKLKEIKVLEERQRWGFFLFPTQIDKIEKKEDFKQNLEKIKAGTWIPPKKTDEETVDLNDAVLYDIVEEDGDEKKEVTDDVGVTEENLKDIFNALDDVLDADYSVVENIKTT